MAATKLSIIIFGLAILTRFTFLQISAADATSYIGAVAEYYPTRTGRDGQINTLANAENIVTIVKKASEYNADIIVFPENGLAPGLPYSDTNRTQFLSYSSIIPDANTDTPCTNDSTIVSPAIRLISCTARSQSMYLTVNVVEMEDCTATGTKFRPCPNDGYFFYNTNVAFNRNGTIVSRYRKFNLFGEAGLNITSTPDISTFTTDFGVTFGHFICFDILFKTPALSLINHYNITDILYPTQWFSELPYLTAVQTQSAWSYSNDVNLLASSYNNPATGSGGSGIFAGTSGQLVSLWSENATNTLLVAKVPKVINGKRSFINSEDTVTYVFSDKEISTLVDIRPVAQQFLKTDILEPYTTRILELTSGTTQTSMELCNRGLCCSFNIRKTFNASIINPSVSYYRYRIAVFNGVRTYSGITTSGTQICSIISCTGDTVATCGRRFTASITVVRPTVFHSIVITGNFSTDSSMFQMPDSLTMNILPLNTNDFTYAQDDISDTSHKTITYTLNTEKNDLLTFAIYGRNFSADGLPPTTSSSVFSIYRLSLIPYVITIFVAGMTILFSMHRF